MDGKKERKGDKIRCHTILKKKVSSLRHLAGQKESQNLRMQIVWAMQKGCSGPNLKLFPYTLTKE